jgi:hypothetical protein
MGTLIIGRVGMDVAMPDPQGFDERTDGGPITLSLRGQVKNATTLAIAQAMKAELLAQVGRIVPLTYSTDAAIDGFYTLNSASLTTDRQYAPYTNFLFPFTAELTRIDSPTWEMVYTGGIMPNAHAIAHANDKGMVAIPATFAWASDPSGAVTSATVNCDGDDARIYYALDAGWIRDCAQARTAACLPSPPSCSPTNSPRWMCRRRWLTATSTSPTTTAPHGG